MDAVKNGPREKILYVVTVQSNREERHGDYISTVDVDPQSPTYCKVIHRTYTLSPGDEMHHSGWNTCSSCHDSKDPNKKVPTRDKLILPCVNSDNIYVVDTGKNPRKPSMYKKIDGKILNDNNLTAPHTSHCLANGNIMISTMGDREGNAKGDFVVFNSNFEFIETWTKGKTADHGYDFWYQPYFDVMVASEWGAPKLFRRGFQPSDVVSPKDYGRSINFYKWSEQKLMQTINLGDDGIAPLEIRFMHDPKKAKGFVGCCLNSNVYHFWKKDDCEFEYDVKKVIDVPSKQIEGWMGPILNGMTSDILISLDDRFLYINNWLHGDVRQYDITNPMEPKLVAKLFLTGIINSDPKLKYVDQKDIDEVVPPAEIKGRRLEGGPQMLQLSLDGKRLYISSSLFTSWDKQFYPNMVKKGGTIIQIDCNTEKGGMVLNKNFLVDFANEPFGPSVPHEMRYPGGDCTSDIWVANDKK